MQQPNIAPNLPTEVAQAAMASQLGPLNHIYKPRISNPLAVIGIVAGIIIADIILFLALLFLTDYIFYALIIIPIIAIVYGIYGLTHYNVRIYEFSAGLIAGKESKLDAIRWENIAVIWHDQQRTRRYGSYGLLGVFVLLIFKASVRDRYTLQRQDGTTIIVDNRRVLHAEILGSRIEREVVGLHMPQALTAYNSGQVLPFGPLQISQQGIIRGKGDLLPWPQVGNVMVDQGRLLIKQQGKMFNWVALPLNKVPNVAVFTELINYARQGAGQPLY
ncbi:DUF6585 family protein [Dictyobacter arantiisoli]|uniref:Uncharacterized protein n=1 Tax=Dictyobacter arantiisoli TaxID=2014874 RepID=A0A5A5T833_9CHLR|nr:DUF6585 family protein [Dictyobacter arantiisoli]GCF07562.1 hypothetical protein KDI_11260 [Dictyobacter arantiisoli]